MDSDHLYVGVDVYVRVSECLIVLFGMFGVLDVVVSFGSCTVMILCSALFKILVFVVCCSQFLMEYVRDYRILYLNYMIC